MLAAWSVIEIILPVVLIGSGYSAWTMLESSIFLPFLYSRVRCCHEEGLPAQYDITSPEEMQLILDAAASLNLDVTTLDGKISACAVPAFPPHFGEWSRSAKCVNKAYVQNEAQSLVGTYLPCQKVVAMILMPVGGAIADVHGRRTVLQAYIFMCAIACAIFLIDCTQSMWGIGPVILAGMFISPCWEAKDTMLTCCIFDLSGTSWQTKIRGLSLFNVFCCASLMAGYGLGFVVLCQHLTTYYWFWFAQLIAALGLLLTTSVFFGETLPANFVRSVELRQLNPITASYDMLSLVRKDWVLTFLLFHSFLFYMQKVGFLTQHFSYMQRVGFSTQEAVAPNILGTIFEMGTTWVVSNTAGKVGCWKMMMGGQMCYVLSHIFWGPLLFTVGHGAPYIAWMFMGVGTAIWMPAIMAVMSDRVEEVHQAKIQAAWHWTNNIGIIAGAYIWNRYFWDATGNGLGRILPALGSLAVCTLNVSMLSVIQTLVVDMRMKHSVPGSSCDSADTRRSV
uniref:Major facilitator superfamily (MFS) profile domain-containing protein n=1 Tax=Noctiluca scintillans TaxID=2966 RepID=A0A7S1AS18_NOCSC